MTRVAVVAVGYNRPASLSRLLASLCAAEYQGDAVDLVISLDHSELREELVHIARRVEWRYGAKEIIAYTERLGLRDHILRCGDLTADYDAVIVFEDDIVASRQYYGYARACLESYGSTSEVAGIALYSPAYNEFAGKPFQPALTGYDTYLIQAAESWGQCWNRQMWSGFREWIANHSQLVRDGDDLPLSIYQWPESSWKKYYMKYVVSTNKYFVYPYRSLSTNFHDLGTHVRNTVARYQVPLLEGKREVMCAPLVEAVRYDVFFERQELWRASAKTGIPTDLTVDMYGLRTWCQSRYLLTRRKLAYRIVQTFGLRMRPHESNVLYGISGDDIFLYDLGEHSGVKFRKSPENSMASLDYYGVQRWQEAIEVGFRGAATAAGRYVRKLTRKTAVTHK